jgi:ABC-type xylose transport system substrate-binding protein
MLTKGAKVLVIASIDGTTLTDVLQEGPRSWCQGHRL